ncbi:hypothetical protein SLEP1_g13583 [Rubroshorea leprosula]|uniref:C3H1-type domain-containing protein n=1 Tax=Rubroshorea leprosula TaxID=152421 RepID=A0AAV5IM56_9ROSI|nr:hypothetical protein SLEP1_g13583 [Rubroshorea leprosula]
MKIKNQSLGHSLASGGNLIPSTPEGTVKNPSLAAMPTSSAVATLADDVNHLPPPETEQQGSDSDTGNVDDDGEEEERAEVEEDDEEVDLPGSSHGSDVSTDILESSGKGIKLGSGYSTQEKCGMVLPSSKLSMGDNSCNSKLSGPANEPLRTEKEYRGMKFEVSMHPISAVSEKDAGLNADGKVHLCVGDSATNSSSVTGKEVIPSIPIRCHSGEVVNSIPRFGQEIQQIDIQSVEDRKRTSSRSAASDMRTEVMSPGVDFNNENKRPAIICGFFARGWCIKGSLCRFLHVRDNINVADQQTEGGATIADRQQVLQLDEGLRNATERSKAAASSNALPSSVGYKSQFPSHISSEGILPWKHDESQRLHSFPEDNKFSSLQREDISMATSPSFKQYSSSKDDPESFRDARKESEGQNLPADDYMKSSSHVNVGSSPVFRSIFLSEFRSSSNGPVTSSGDCQSQNQSSNISSLEELTSRIYHRLNSHSSLGLSHFPTPNFSNSFPAIGISPSYRASTWIGSSPFHSFTLSSKPENLALTILAGHPLQSADYKAKISSDDWKPSVPFRPTFFIIPSTSSPQSQYDPLQDSIDSPNFGDRDYKFSFSAPGVSVLNATYQLTYSDSTSTRTPGRECNGDKSTRSNRIQEGVLDSNRHTSGKGSLATEAKTEGTSVVDMQIGKLVKEEISSDASHVKGISKTNKVDMDLDDRYQSDCSRHRKDIKVDSSVKNNETDIEQKLDGNVLKESKAARFFRVALIDVVKGMLKPTWHEGHLSKDAHNTIVKKAVDKVLSSLRPHQIPVTTESAKQYLSLSQPKIAKLVKGYIERYGKS